MFNEYSHRQGDSRECPFCGNIDAENVWLLRKLDQTNLGETAYDGTPKIRIASSCVKCGEISWAHYLDLEYINLISKSRQRRVQVKNK